MRVTAIVPAALIEAANHVHVLLGKSKNLSTYGEPSWQDAQGNLYAVSSGLWSDVQIAGVTNPDVLSQIEPPEGVDMVLVAQAQAAFSLWQPGEDAEGVSSPVPLADTDTILAVVGDGPQTLLSATGITRILDDAAV